MSPERMPIPPIGRRPSNGDVDLGTGMYLMAGVHSSEDISVEASAGDSVAATAVDVLAEDKRTEEEETGATDDNIAEDKGASDEDGGTAEDRTVEDCATGDSTAEDGATDDAGTLLDTTDNAAEDEAGTTAAEDAGRVADDTTTDG